MPRSHSFLESEIDEPSDCRPPNDVAHFLYTSHLIPETDPLLKFVTKAEQEQMQVQTVVCMQREKNEHLRKGLRIQDISVIG